MNAIEWIIEQIGHTAEWRGEKAEEFPDDSRNLEAVKKLQNLANEVRALANSKTAKNIGALDDLTDKLQIHPGWVEWLNEQIGGIGFRTGYGGASLLDALLEEMGDDLRLHGHEDEVIALLGPTEDDIIDRDEAVKAADQALDKARQTFKQAEKAYQEARKQARARLVDKASVEA